MKLQQRNGLEEHLKQIVELFDELAAVGDPITEEDRIICILASLPENFSTIVTALEALELVPTLETYMEQLLHEENKRTVTDDTSVSFVSNKTRREKKTVATSVMNVANQETS